MLLRCCCCSCSVWCASKRHLQVSLQRPYLHKSELMCCERLRHSESGVIPWSFASLLAGNFVGRYPILLATCKFLSTTTVQSFHSSVTNQAATQLSQPASHSISRITQEQNNAYFKESSVLQSTHPSSRPLWASNWAEERERPENFN